MDVTSVEGLMSVEDNPFARDVYAGYQLLGIKKEGGLSSRVLIAKDAGFKLAPEQLDVVLADTLRGLQLAHRIAPTIELAEYETRIVSSLVGFASEDGRVGQVFLDATPEARSAGTLHEAMHVLEEDEGLVWGNSEGLPVLAEFLFTKGAERMDSFFDTYEQFLDKKTEPHAKAWEVILPLLGVQMAAEMPREQQFQALIDYKIKLTEEDKIVLVQKAIGLAKPVGSQE
jgi:hypothetical protein